MSRLRILVLGCICGLVFAASRTQAADRTIDFIHALQTAGYGDTAVEYMKSLAVKKQIPPELAEVWDLELSESYQAEAEHAFNEQEAKTSTEAAEKHLALFIKNHPNHPAANLVFVRIAVQQQKKGLELLGQAQANPDKEAAKKQFAEARQNFDATKPLLQNSMERYKKQLKALPAPPKGPAANPKAVAAFQQAVEDFEEARFRLFLLDIYIAQTIPELRDPVRVKMLQTVSKDLDGIYQANRSNGVGLASHMWQGTVEEELGNTDKALDIFDEVLSYGPDVMTANSKTVLDELFAHVEYKHLLLLLKKKKETEFLTEAGDWLKALRQNKANISVPHYQGVALEFIKASFATAAKATGPNKLKLENDAKTLLAESVKTQSPFQQQIIKLNRQFTKTEGQKPTTMEEAFGLAQSALATSNLEEARKYGELALALAPKNAEKARIAEVKDMLSGIRFNAARDLYTKGKYEECMDAAEKMAHDHDAGDLAAVASNMCVQAAFGQYLKETDAAAKEKILERMSKYAEYTIATWPGKPEADDARMLLGQAHLVNNKPEAAVDVFKKMNIKSEKYPVGMYLAGRTFWYRYRDEKNKPEADRNVKQMESDRAGAVEYLTKSYEMLKASYVKGQPIPKQVLETQLLLGEVALEGDKPDEALKLLRPLVDDYGVHKPQSFDRNVLRTFTAAVRAYIAKGDFVAAGDVGKQLVDLGPDQSDVNDFSIGFLRLLDGERKKIEAEKIEKDSPALRNKLTQIKKTLSDVADKLKDREQISAANMKFLGDLYAAIDQADKAANVYQSMLDRVEKDPNSEYAEVVKKAEMAIRSQLVSLLRKQGDYEKALKAAQELIAKNERALEPRMEECQILQTLAEKDSDPSRLDHAAMHWNQLRTMLQGVKPRPKEYYLVLYNTANCLVIAAERIKATDKTAAATKALQAEKVLNTVLIPNPSLDGPDTVALYKELIKKAAAIQGRVPEETKEPEKK